MPGPFWQPLLDSCSSQELPEAQSLASHSQLGASLALSELLSIQGLAAAAVTS